ncbi:MAG: ChaB family protein [Cyanophyceae cyanobacterium]
MAYEKMEDLPADVREKLPEGGQKRFMAAFNSASSDGLSDEGATQVAWNSIKNEYEEGPDGKWQHKPDRAATSSPLGSIPAS